MARVYGPQRRPKPRKRYRPARTVYGCADCGDPGFPRPGLVCYRCQHGWGGDGWAEDAPEADPLGCHSSAF